MKEKIDSASLARLQAKVNILLVLLSALGAFALIVLVMINTQTGLVGKVEANCAIHEKIIQSNSAAVRSIHSQISLIQKNTAVLATNSAHMKEDIKEIKEKLK